ncbi:hypothetical protein [Robertkochia sediminum]|uniref:hypothetical protein n=1 Tax=Robertkochia sediminum TaxID=2785326 RepID=UPI001F26103D|nr:hypothetical protein [Robertkochia sediminum]
MRHLFIWPLLALAMATVSCDNSETDRNPYLLEPRFSIDLNLNLPQYGSLNIAGNALYVGGNNVGIKGIIVYHQGFGQYVAWEASCPNHVPNDCSTLTIEGGVSADCGCDDFTYSLLNGAMLNEFSEDGRPYPLLNYRVQVNGPIITVFN